MAGQKGKTAILAGLAEVAAILAVGNPKATAIMAGQKVKTAILAGLAKVAAILAVGKVNRLESKTNSFLFSDENAKLLVLRTVALLPKEK